MPEETSRLAEKIEKETNREKGRVVVEVKKGVLGEDSGELHQNMPRNPGQQTLRTKSLTIKVLVTFKSMV